METRSGMDPRSKRQQTFIQEAAVCVECESESHVELFELTEAVLSRHRLYITDETCVMYGDDRNRGDTMFS